MNSTPQQQDTQYRAQKMSMSLAMSLKQVVHPGELEINPAIRLHTPEMRKHLSPICLRLAVAMKKQAMGQATISEMLRMICSTKMSIWNLSMAELGPMQSALSRKSRQARLIVLFLRDLYLKRCFMVKLLRQFYCCSCYFFSSITLTTYYSVTWHSNPLIYAILLRLFSTAALPFLQRQLGVSSKQSTIKSSRMKAGSVQKKVVTCLQSLSQQQAIDTKTPATPNEHCSISEYFCLRWQSTIQFKMAMLMRMLDSQPAPASNKPTLAMNMFLLRLMSTKPATAVDQVRISPNLRPKLSEKCMNTMYPIKTPKNRVILQVAMLDIFWQWQSPSSVTSEFTILVPQYFDHWFQGRAQTKALHCYWLGRAGQVKWVGKRRKATPRMRKAVMNQSAKKRRKMWRWYLPLVPTLSRRMKNSSSWEAMFSMSVILLISAIIKRYK